MIWNESTTFEDDNVDKVIEEAARIIDHILPKVLSGIKTAIELVENDLKCSTVPKHKTL